MRALKGALLVVCAGLLLAAACPTAKADEWNEKTDVRVYVPVEVPGHVLTPGKYVFELANLPSERDLVQIWNGDQTHLIASIFAIPTYRMDATGHTVIRLEERMSDNPEAIKKWFYPGNNYGLEFVYHYRWPSRESTAMYNGG
ncbi:MAG TPA: hypothetical protein VLV88_13455 [Terriglobales bacterium]|nr:hypothetical protein [Terriglobales bacterium]